MSAPASNRLPWLDRPWAELIRLSWPIAVSTISYSLMTLVDTLFVSGLGTAALAGVGLGGMAAFTLVCFSIGMLRSVKVLVSQAIGGGRPGEAGSYLDAGVTLALVLGALTTALAFLVAPLLPALAANAEAGGHAESYLRIRALGSTMLLVYVAMREARYGRGDARTPMFAAVAGNAINIVLDYVFIVMLGVGVTGAAWATIIAQAVEASILIWAEPGVRPFARGRRRHLAAVWRVGLPTGVQFVLEVGSFAMLTALISAMSELEMAAHQIVLHLLHFAFLPAFAVAEAGSVLAGQAVGADRDDLVLGIARRAMILTGGYALACMAVLFSMPHTIVSMFRAEPELLSAAVSLLYVAAVFQIADAANIVARGILRGAGDVRYPAVVGIICAWVTIPPLTWLLGHRLGLGALGGWIGLCTEIFAGAALFWWRLGRGGWQTSAARSRAALAESEGEVAAVVA
jgi:multidrug resistance protein, MATE family